MAHQDINVGKQNPVKPPITVPQDPPSILNAGATAPTQTGVPIHQNPIQVTHQQVAPAFGVGPQGVTDEMLKNLQFQQLSFQLAQYQAQGQAVEDAKQRLQVQRLQNLEVHRSKIAEIAFQQANCSHRKEDNKSHVVGQRDHRQNTHYTCQACQKDWHEGPGFTNDELYNPRNYAQGAKIPINAEKRVFAERISRELVPIAKYIGGPVVAAE